MSVGHMFSNRLPGLRRTKYDRLVATAALYGRIRADAWRRCGGVSMASCWTRAPTSMPPAKRPKCRSSGPCGIAPTATGRSATACAPCSSGTAGPRVLSCVATCAGSGRVNAHAINQSVLEPGPTRPRSMGADGTAHPGCELPGRANLSPSTESALPAPVPNCKGQRNC